MQSQHKHILKTLIRSDINNQLPSTLTTLLPALQQYQLSPPKLLHTWNLYLCRYIRTKQPVKARQILHIMQKVLHYFSLIGQMADPYIPILMSNNGASLAESEWNFAQAQTHLEAMLEYIDSCAEKVLEAEQAEFSKAAQLKRLEIKVRLQLAGVYSQIEKHEKAIIMADSAVRLVYQFCLNMQINFKEVNEKNTINERSREMLQFLIRESEPEKVINNSVLQKIRQQLCAWKQNSDLSSQHLKKLIKTTKLKTQLLTPFQIGDIMQVLPMLSYQLPSSQSTSDLIVIQQLQQLTLELSVGYFTLGTELYYQKTKNNKKSTIDKYKNIFQNQYKREQLFHLQAMTLAANTIGFDTPYVQHLIKVFNDNYHGLQIIQERREDESNMSIRLEDTRGEAVGRYGIAVEGRKDKQGQKDKERDLNDSLFDLSVEKTKKRSDQTVRNKRSSLATTVKSENK